MRVRLKMNEYKALVSIMAECESDFKEQLDALDCYELEWFSQIVDYQKEFNYLFK